MKKPPIRLCTTLLLTATFPTVSTAQLPPSIEADRLLVRAERQINEQDYTSALSTLEQILQLQDEHQLQIPVAFWFKHAEVSLEAGYPDQAISSVNRYLEIAGTNGAYYMEALQLSDSAEIAKDKPEPTCDGLAPGTSCWLLLANHPRCYAYSRFLDPDKTLETSTWDGDCIGGLAQGYGTLTIKYDSRSENTWVGRGTMRAGNLEGSWSIDSHKSGESSEGSYSRGIRTGKWELNSANATHVGEWCTGTWLTKEHGGNTFWGPRELTDEGCARIGLWKVRTHDGENGQAWYRSGEVDVEWRRSSDNEMPPSL